jgi:hypothetical protein
MRTGDHRRRRGTSCVIALGAVIVLLVASPVGARVRKYDTTIVPLTGEVAGFTHVAFSGELLSKKSECYAGRTVTVAYVENGQTVFFGSADSDQNGDFTVTGHGPDDVDYVFSVAKVRRGNTVCRPAQTT